MIRWLINGATPRQVLAAVLLGAMLGTYGFIRIQNVLSGADRLQAVSYAASHPDRTVLHGGGFKYDPDAVAKPSSDWGMPPVQLALLGVLGFLALYKSRKMSDESSEKKVVKRRPRRHVAKHFSLRRVA